MSVSKAQLKKYAYNNCFVETGTNEGRCVKAAVDLGFAEIYSIEIDCGLYKKACERFKKCSNVKLICGDSSEELKKILESVDRPATIYLDAHKGNENTQIWSELEAIKNHYIKGSVILIDDMGELFKADEVKRLNDKILEMDGSFEIYRIDGRNINHGSIKHNDILVAEVKNGD